jgi:hypothetical protein
VLTLPLAALDLCMLPDLLVGVEDYPDRLAALTEPKRGHTA